MSTDSHWPRRRRRLRHRDRRARPRRRRAALPRRRPRGARRAACRSSSVWGLLVDGDPDARARARRRRTSCPSARATRASTCRRRVAQLAPAWGSRRSSTSTPRQARDDLARTSSALLSFAAQSARGADLAPVPPRGRRRGQDARRALPARVARRGRPGRRPGHRRLLGLRRRARHERLDVHRPRRRVDRRRRAGGAERRDRRALRPAARRCALARAADARRGRAQRRRGAAG